MWVGSIRGGQRKKHKEKSSFRRPERERKLWNIESSHSSLSLSFLVPTMVLLFNNCVPESRPLNLDEIGQENKVMTSLSSTVCCLNRTNFKVLIKYFVKIVKCDTRIRVCYYHIWLLHIWFSMKLLH